MMPRTNEAAVVVAPGLRVVKSAPRLRRHRRKPEAYLDERRVAAAYELYRDGHSLLEIANEIWWRYGYSSRKSCAYQLFVAFKRDGLPLRSPTEAQRVRVAARVRARDVAGRFSTR